MSNDTTTDPKNGVAAQVSTSILHMRWVIAILAGLLIAMATIKWTRHGNLADFVGFAGNLVSIVLGVVAIIYAFLSNGSLTNTVSGLEQAARSMITSAADIRNQMGTVLEHVVKSREISEQLLDNKASAGQKTEATTPLTPQQAGPVVAPQPGAPAQAVNESAIRTKMGTEITDYFLAQSSWNGLKVLLCCKRSVENASQIFDLRAICLQDKRMSYDYAFAYMVASSSVGFLEHSSPSNGAVRVTRMLQPLVASLEPAIAARQTTGAPNVTPEIQEMMRSEIAQINAIFAK